MTLDIRWELLGSPANVGESFTRGFEHGRALRQRGRQESAFAALATDPTNPQAIAELAAINPQGAAWFQDRADKARVRDMRRQVVDAFSGTRSPPVAVAPQASTPAVAPDAALPITPRHQETPRVIQEVALPPSTAAGALPGPSEPAAAPVIASAPTGTQTASPYNIRAIHELWVEDPDSAKEIMALVKGMDKDTRDQTKAEFEAAAPLFMELMRVPQEQRGQLVQQYKPLLNQMGWSDDEIAARAGDLSDGHLRMLGALGAGISHYRTLTNPLEVGQGQTLVDPFRQEAIGRTPTREQRITGYDAAGNQIVTVIPGDPGFGLGAPTFAPAETVSTPGAEPVASGGTGKGGGGGVPRTVRLNNPGALEASKWTQGQPGYVGSDGRYARFDTPENGRRAAETLVRNYITRGFDTPAKIVNRWAPASENGATSTNNYVSYVAEKLGIGPNDRVDGDLVPLLVQAKAEWESGIRPGGSQTARNGVQTIRTGGSRPPSKPEPRPGFTKVASKAEYDALPRGSKYIAPDGSRRVKP